MAIIRICLKNIEVLGAWCWVLVIRNLEKHMISGI